MECKGRSHTSITLLTVTSTMTLWCLAPLAPATGQITPDGTLGTENSIVTRDVNIKDIPSDRIDGGAIRGTNLFHSFAQFNVESGRGAYFTNPNGIENILSRITGSNPSNIQGTLGVLGQANLFLINPNGIVFGAKAKLDVRGSFVASTASAITLADGAFFSASDLSSPPLLTISMPVGLQYRTNAGSIQVEESRLSVPKGETLALVGGTVGLDGASLKAPEGRVTLGGVAGLGIVELNVNSNDLRLSFPNDVALTDISLINKAVIDVSGEGGGAIQVQGRQVTFADESKVSAITTGDRNGQGISINAVQFTINSGAQVSASTTGEGNGGNVDIIASDLVELIGTSADGQRPSRLANDLQRASGNAGNLTITTSRLFGRAGARISASAAGPGRGGDININASKSVELIGASPNERRPSGVSVQTSQGSANAGDLTITTSQLSIQNGAEVSAATFGDGDGGTVQVNASDSVELIGTSASRKFSSRLFAGTGKPSDVMRDGNSQSDMGDASDVSTGDGGNLIVNTRQLTVRDGAQISVGSQGTGNAGDLEITANSIYLNNKASITADTTSLSPEPIQGQGNILLRSPEVVLRNGSSISTNATGTTTGGNITIDTDVLAALENSDITANATNSRGGNVTINAQGIFGTKFREAVTPESEITATGKDSSLNGTVTINTPEVDPSRGLVTLPETVVDPATLIAQNACERAKGSAFVVTGRGGLPSNPSHTLSYDTVQVGLIEPTSSTNNSSTKVTASPSQVKTEQMVPAQGWVFNAQGEVVLTAYNPTSSEPQRPWLNPAACGSR